MKIVKPKTCLNNNIDYTIWHTFTKQMPKIDKHETLTKNNKQDEANKHENMKHVN